jgi:hypothetical protein
MSTVSEMSEKGPLWDAMVGRYGLFPTPYEQIANWAFVDFMLNFPEETILSTNQNSPGLHSKLHLARHR